MIAKVLGQVELEVQHWVALVFFVLEVFVDDPELDVFAEASFDVQLGSLVLEAAFSNHLETGSSVRDKTIDVLL